MSSTTDAPAPPAGKLVKIPMHRTIGQLARDPLRAFEQLGRDADGALARLNLGLTRPYLVTHPDHVQHILRKPDVYRREGMMWKPIRRLEGDGIAGEGPFWQTSRRILQPLFTAKNITSLLRPMESAVTEALDELAARAAGSRPVDVATEMTRIMNRVLVRVFFSDRISLDDADRLGEAISTAFVSLGARMLLPFVSDSVPLPGDRAFRRAVNIVDELIYPRIRACRAAGSDGDDLVALLARAVDENGDRLDDKRVRDDVVAMFVAGTETTALALTWLWLLLDAHPQAAERVTDEVREVIGDDTPRLAHLPGLAYTRMALQETLRLYPVGWILPRTVAQRDVLDGTVLPRGTTVLLSPYLTQRLEGFWEDPYEFTPQRFATDREQRQHRFAYFPFGAGAHQCLGSHFFTVEAQLVVAGLLSRFRPEIVGPRSLQARATASLRPRDNAQMVLHPLS
jgi:cytochrome P450